MREVRAVWSSRERKAADAAAILAEQLGLRCADARAARGERPLHDGLPAAGAVRARACRRSSASRCSATAAGRPPRPPRSGSPTRSRRCSRARPDGDVAIVSHGGVGTLLLCHLKGTAIHRAEDQPGQGHWFAFDRDTRARAARLAPALSVTPRQRTVVQASDASSRTPPGGAARSSPSAAASPCSPPSRARLRAGLHLRGERPRRHPRPVAPQTEPITANKGEPACKAAPAGGNVPASPLPSPAACCSATTDLEPPTGAPSAQTASAAGGLGSLAIAGLPIPLERPDLSGAPRPADDPRRRDDRHPRRRRGAGARPFNAELLNLRALRAEVTGRCVNGAPQLTGTSSVLGISVLGTELPGRPRRLADDQRRRLVEHRPVEPHARRSSAAGRRHRPGVQPVLDAAADDLDPGRPSRSSRVTPGRKIRGRRQAHPARARPHAHASAARTSSTSRSARRPSAPRTSTAAASPTSRCSARRAGSC